LEEINFLERCVLKEAKERFYFPFLLSLLGSFPQEVFVGAEVSYCDSCMLY
jgi:hypothetical protein